MSDEQQLLLEDRMASGTADQRSKTSTAQATLDSTPATPADHVALELWPDGRNTHEGPPSLFHNYIGHNYTAHN